MTSSGQRPKRAGLWNSEFIKMRDSKNIDTESNDKRSYYAIIPANVRYDNTLCPNAKLLYGEITALCNEKGYCWARNSYFVGLYEKSARTISRWISQLIKAGYIRADGNQKGGNNRKLYLVTEMSIPIDKNVYIPPDKNVHQNNTDIILQDNKIKVLSIDLSKAGAQERGFRLLRQFGVGEKVARRLVYEQHTPLKSIEEAIKNGLAKQQSEERFVLQPGYIVAALNGAKREVKLVEPTKQSKALKRRIERMKQRKNEPPIGKREFEKRRQQQIEALGA